jgi:hypothetical protein
MPLTRRAAEKSRWILTVVACVALLLAIWRALSTFPETEKGAAAELTFTQPLQTAVEMYATWSEKNADWALVGIAVLWGFVFAAKDSVRLEGNDLPAWISCACANLILGGTVGVHQSFTRKLSSAFADSARLTGKDVIPDVFSPLFDWAFKWEVWFLGLGFLAAFCTIISIRYLKPK